MKTAAFYTVFNSCELLSASIRQIEAHVDKVFICYQTVSNTGERINPKDIFYINEANENFNSRLIHYVTKNVNPKENERRKLQLMLDFAKDYDAFVLLAADHFYKPEEFKNAKDFLAKNRFDVSLTKMFTFYKYPTWQLEPIEAYYMPFICRINADTKVSVDRWPYVVDPSVKVGPVRSFHEFKESEFMLFHYSMIRDDISSKFRNAAAAQNWPDKIEAFENEFKNYDIKENVGVSYFGGRKIKVVKNYFNL